MFAALYSFDLPHNLFPSLHIALRTLLASTYLRFCGGPWRWLTHVWFSLVGISTLVTWQHHIVDVLGGFWLGAIAIHLFRFDETLAPRSSNRTIAIGYAILALACSQVARISWPWTFPFVWPAFAFVPIEGPSLRSDRRSVPLRSDRRSVPLCIRQRCPKFRRKRMAS